MSIIFHALHSQLAHTYILASRAALQGGGSVQEAFALESGAVQSAPKASVVKLKGGGKEYSVYVHRCVHVRNGFTLRGGMVVRCCLTCGASIRAYPAAFTSTGLCSLQVTMVQLLTALCACKEGLQREWGDIVFLLLQQQDLHLTLTLLPHFTHGHDLAPPFYTWLRCSMLPRPCCSCAYPCSCCGCLFNCVEFVAPCPQLLCPSCSSCAHLPSCLIILIPLRLPPASPFFAPAVSPMQLPGLWSDGSQGQACGGTHSSRFSTPLLWQGVAPL